jgi:malic enzyme
MTDSHDGRAPRRRRVLLRGQALIDEPLLNKGTCFTHEERDRLGLRGLLPPAVATEEEQAVRAYGNFLRAEGDLGRYVFLASLQDRNETLFYRLLMRHIDEMAPVFYTPTVGRICEEYSHIYRRPRGLYVSAADRGHIAGLLRNSPRTGARVLVITDNEAILGLGDQGVGGMAIAIGKLALYTAGAGVHPAIGLPVDFDVGTDNERLLDDPLYLGARHRRLRGEEYFSLLDELVEGIATVFPGALVQWEDFASRNAFVVLDRYRQRVPSFNDDVQGTAAVVVAGIRAALRQVGRPISDERVVFLGAGAAGGGCALAVREAMRGAGVAEDQIRRRVLAIDSRGLLLDDRGGFELYQTRLAAPRDLVAGWQPDERGAFRLTEVVRRFHPTILIGASGQPNSFTEEVVREMHRYCARPIFLPLSNPTSRVEAQPADLIRWTNGAAVVGTGSPFEPVFWNGIEHHIAQGNNVLVFPGIGLGATAVGARVIPDEAVLAAGEAVFECTEASSAPGAPIYPPLTRLREVSRRVALQVARCLVAAGVAEALTPSEIESRIESLVWEPVYDEYEPEVETQ